ncbi:hypothetical protein M422DRAFT_232201 [Sphaerobolus stellatus SS14]|uniref:Major facilitator superfamily (MFS) profile domain-containing protein n=1 Tax=Sphaerobolus stellatus (strain SS14) TaxID=990650 RepID=A0A0C9VHH3_SPHS4|nr:hypothetical protein M422DRAFT_232201 [Sphaerobolus stellatus SS14]
MVKQEEPVSLHIRPVKLQYLPPSYHSSIQRLSDVELSVINEQKTSDIVSKTQEGDGDDEIQTKTEEILPNSSTRNSKPPHVYLQLAVVFYTVFLLGFQDGTLGPLIPVIQRVYHVDFKIVSLNYVFGCIGLVAGALINIQIGQRVGFGKMILAGAILQMIGYCILAPAPPFPVLLLGQTIVGLGEALQNIQSNTFVAAFGSSTKLGLFHGIYGIGALIAPLIATQFAQMPRWSFHWLVGVALAAINVVLLASVFRLRDRNELIEEPTLVTNGEQNKKVKWKEVLSLRSVNTLAFFIFVYCGVEFTLGAWVVTFIIDQRHGSANSGYISSGFFAGLMVGRFSLIWVNNKIGTRKVMFLYAFLALGLEFTIWFIPNLIGNAASISLIGLFMGPMFPLIMGHAQKIIPTRLLSGSISWICGLGTVGVSSLPFVEGAIANKFGIGSLQPFLVVMMCILIGLWATVPNVKRRSE